MFECVILIFELALIPCMETTTPISYTYGPPGSLYRHELPPLGASALVLVSRDCVFAESRIPLLAEMLCLRQRALRSLRLVLSSACIALIFGMSYLPEIFGGWSGVHLHLRNGPTICVVGLPDLFSV